MVTTRLAVIALAPAIALYVGASVVLPGGGSEPMIGVAFPLPTIATRANALALPIVAKGAAFRGATKTPTSRPTATTVPTATRIAVRPADPDALRRAVTTPGALVIPAPGAYRMRTVVQVAAGVTLDGRGQVQILDRGVYLYKADGVTIRGLTIIEPSGDGISVNASTGTLIEDVTIQGPAGDGGLDIVHSRSGGGSHVLRRVTIRGVVKGMLLGHQLDGNDNALRVTLDRVTFENCRVRVPKIHRARVSIIGGTVFHWSGPMLDVQLSGHVDMRNTAWIAGKDSVRDYQLITGATMVEEGTTYRPWEGAQ